MELEISDESDSGGGGSGINSGDIVQNVEKALENPQIRGLVSAVMKQNGIDPSEFGLASGEMAAESLPSAESGGDETLIAISSADEIIEFVNEISAMSPLGDKTKLGTVRDHIEENKSQIETRLREAGGE